MNSIKAGGWMKYKKKRAFTLIESIIYIFLSVIILAEGINIFIPMYKTYLEVRAESIRANEYKNFCINLNNIISEGRLKEISAGEDNLTLCKSDYGGELKKIIRVCDGKVVAVYSEGNRILTYNNMLYEVEQMEVYKKNKLIYVNIYTMNGERIICCI
ncbi:competence type IV pilus minor pilin ComGF [uncultured Clostridium sp.]|uniref:competence type IV pilus minor pilin ComGF n=1 Tax=uncultured Clostridium sp. TaxID=59620 RepID=UPI002600A7B8|nr:competence type IV pilus minor pilin ComGF [uncultured Clostridium sp.]